MKHTLNQWFVATRPWSFSASAMPVLVTLSFIFATHCDNTASVNWLLALPCLVGTLLFHAGGNLLSDYYDYKTGVDRNDNTGQRMLVDGVFEPKTFLAYGLTLIAAGCITGIIIVCLSNIYILYTGLIGCLLTLLYSKLKYNTLGDLDVFLIFGILESVGTSFALLNHLDMNALLCTIPVGFLVVTILHSNNTRDSELDGRAHITTVAMKIGLRGSKIYYFALVIAAYVMTEVLVDVGICAYPTRLCLLSLPLAIRNLKMMANCKQLSDINGLDGQSSKLVLFFSTLIIIGNLMLPIVK